MNIQPQPAQPDQARQPGLGQLLLALLMPCWVFFSTGRRLEGWLCLLFQLTLVGWLPAALFAADALRRSS